MPDYSGGIITGSFDTTENEGAANGLSGPAVDQIVLFPTSAVITSFQATCEDGAGVIRAERNVNSDGTATQGTIAIESNTIGAQTYQFVAHFLGS